MVNQIPCRVTDEMKDWLWRSYTADEVVKATNEMHPSKAPGPDGTNPFFYQNFWPIMDNDVSNLVLAILNGAAIPDSLIIPM